MSRISCAIIVILALAALPCSAQGISVSVNGSPVVFTGTGPQSVQGRVLVPLRGVLEKMGAFVEWVPQTRTVIAKRGDVDVELPVGTRAATVNGRIVPLDVPAMVMAGSTMVPLRFLGEALGAEVVWDGVTRHIQISTDGQAPAPAPTPAPTPGAAAAITSFTHDASGWLTAGDTLTVTLSGTPGGTAVFQIPGVVDRVVMQESASGRYAGKWTVPGQGKLAITDAGVLGKLSAGGTDMMIQAGQSVSIDTTAPAITNALPEPNSVSGTAQPGISIALGDSGSGIDPRSVKLTVNGEDVSSDSTVTAGFVAYKPPKALAKGNQEVKVSVSDTAGNVSTLSWAFRVQDAADIIKSFTFEPDGSVQPGDVIAVTMNAPAGGKASFSIGETVTRAMPEASAGVYKGEYTVRKADDLNGEIVKGTFEGKDGRKYTVQAEERIGGALAVKSPDIPVITSPVEGSTVKSPLVVRGTATAGATVRIAVDYQTELIASFATGGRIGEQTVKADAEGRFASEPFELKLLIKGKNTRFAISAVAVGASGEESEAAAVMVKG